MEASSFGPKSESEGDPSEWIAVQLEVEDHGAAKAAHQPTSLLTSQTSTLRTEAHAKRERAESRTLPVARWLMTRCKQYVAAEPVDDQPPHFEQSPKREGQPSERT
jgi:hypothetical protein